MTNKNKISSFVFSLLIPMSYSYSILAAGTNWTWGKNLFSGLINFVVNIINPLAALMLTICLLSVLFANNSKKTEKAMGWGKAIIISFIILNMMGSILSFVKTDVLDLDNRWHLYANSSTKPTAQITYIVDNIEGGWNI